MPDEIINTTAQDNTETVVENATPNTETTDTTETTPDKTDVKTESTTTESPQIGDFSIPDGMAKDEGTLTALKELAIAEGMTQKQAQATLDLYHNKVLPAQKEAIANQIKAWETESLKVHGKQGLEEANIALSRFGNPEYINYLKESGLGNHPQEIAMWRKVYSQISESKLVEGNAVVSKPKSLGELLYPNMK